MTTAFATIVVLRLFLLCGLFAPVAMMAGGDRAATRKAKAARQKTTTARRGKSSRQRESWEKKSKVNRPKAKAIKIKTRPLSVDDQRRFDEYFIGRNFPGWKSSSGIPA